MFTLILLIYGKYYERVWVKIYVGWLKEFDDNKFDNKNKKKTQISTTGWEIELINWEWFWILHAA